MKNLLVIGAVLAAGLQSYGQGTINIINNSATAVTNLVTQQRVVAGTAFRVAVYYLPDSATRPTTADFDLNGILVPNSSGGFQAAGIYNIGIRTAPTSPAGAVGWFQVRAWEFAFGDTYDAAKNNPVAQGGRLALIGTSNVLQIDTGDPTTTPAGTPGTLLSGGLQAFVIAPVPEPSVIGLGIFGIGAMLLLRRRK